MEVHLLPAISADDFPIEEVYERCPDFLGFLHTRLASLRSRLEDVLHLLEVFTGNKRFVRVREHNPLILVLDIMGFDALVDRLHGAAKDGITHIMRIAQDAVQRGTVPAFAGAAVAFAGSVLAFPQFRIWRTQPVKLVKDHRD